MESIEVEVLSPEREYAVVQTERPLAPGDVVLLCDRRGHACSGVVADRTDDPALPGATVAVRLDVADWREEPPQVS